MINTATVPLRGVRTNALVVPINFVGIDLTSATVTAVVLQDWDNDPADPEIALTETPNGNGTGVVVGAVSTSGGIPTSPVTLTIGAADMAAIPDAAEVGETVKWVWYLMIQTDAGDVNTKRRYIEGSFYVGGPASGAGGTGSVTATILDETITVTIDGATALFPAVRGGPLADGVWVKLPALYKLLLDGTGTVTIDTRTRDGTVTSAAASYPSVSGEATEYPYFGDDAYEVRASLTGSATAEIV